MRILLAQNSLYYPAHGGGDKSNRLLVEALAARGHVCRVVARIASSARPDTPSIWKLWRHAASRRNRPPAAWWCFERAVCRYTW